MAERMNDSAAEAAKKGQEATKNVGTPVEELELSFFKTGKDGLVETGKDGKGVIILVTVKAGSVVEYPSTHRLKIKMNEHGQPEKIGAPETGTVQKMYLIEDPQSGEVVKVEIKTAA